MDTPGTGMAVNDPDAVQEGTANLGPSIAGQVDPQNPLLGLPMTPEEAGEWWKRIDASDKRIKEEAESWQVLLDAYTPVVSKAGKAEDVNTNSHFRNVHTKLGQMFVNVPEIRLEPAPNSPADNQKVGPMGVPITLSDVVAVKQEYLNKKLGRDGIKVNRLFDQLILSILSTSGLGCSKLGYKSVTQVVEKPVMGPDPNFIPPLPQVGSVLGLQPTPQPPQVQQMDEMGQPMTQQVPVLIYEEIYWREFSSWKLVTDSMLTSTRHDEDASFMGMRFAMLPSQAASAFGLEEKDLKGGEDDKKAKHKRDQDKLPVVTGVELFAKACFYVKGEIHPWKLVQIVFLDHIKDRPVVYRFSPDQSFTPEGELTEDSLDRFPIRVCTVRDAIDSQFPHSDSAFTNNLVKQRNTNLRQGVALRDAAIGKVLYDSGALEDGDVAKVRNAKPGDWIAVAPEAMAKGVNTVAAPIAQVTRTNDDYRLDSMLQQSMDETLGISANSSGAAEDTVRSATEIQAVQRAVQGRNKKEQNRVIDHFLDGVRLIDILIMRYTTDKQWAKVTGEDGMARMMAWDGQMVSGRWLYDISPDSQADMDIGQDRTQNLAFYNHVAPDPLVNRVPILKRLARQFNYDPAKIVLDPMLVQAGVQPPHGGGSGAERVNDHEAAKSGGKENAPGAVNQQEQAQ